MVDEPSSWKTGEQAVKEFQPTLDALAEEYNRIFPQQIKYPNLQNLADRICSFYKSSMIENLNNLAEQNANVDTEIKNLEAKKIERGETGRSQQKRQIK